MASPNLKRHLFRRLRQRGIPETSKIRELDRGQIVFVFSVEGIVTLELAFSATLDAIPRPLFRACYHSLSRLKGAYSFSQTPRNQVQKKSGAVLGLNKKRVQCTS